MRIIKEKVCTENVRSVETANLDRVLFIVQIIGKQSQNAVKGLGLKIQNITPLIVRSGLKLTGKIVARQLRGGEIRIRELRLSMPLLGLRQTLDRKSVV